MRHRKFLQGILLCILCFSLGYTIKELVVRDGEMITDNTDVLNKNIVYVESFPKQQNELDDTDRIQRAIDYAKDNGAEVVEFALKEYNTSSPLKVYSQIKLRGQHKTKTKIISQGNIPTIASEGYFKAGVGSNGIEIENIGIYPRGVTTKTHYAIEMVNTYNSVLRNCYINELEMTKTDVGGIRFSRDTSYTGNHFVNTVRESQLQNASIVMESTDSYIQQNEIWADKRSFAVHLVKSSQFITSNQIVGSSVKGGVWIEDTKDGYDVELIRITDNFFDGSYNDVDSGVGLNAKNMRNSRITGNDFWRLMDEGIKLTTSHNITMLGNVFSDNNRRNAGKDDILIDKCTSCIGVGNIFNRSNSHTNKGSAIRTLNSSADSNKFSTNSISPSSFYNHNELSNIDMETE